MFVSRLRCVSGTAFGRLSDPLVNRTTAVSRRRRPFERRPAEAAASAPPAASRPGRTDASTSSTNRNVSSMPDRSTPDEPSFATSARAVTTVVTPSVSSECRSARGPVVQFTMTGVLPAKSAASRNTEAPTDAGIMMPMYASGQLLEFRLQHEDRRDQVAVGARAAGLVREQRLAGPAGGLLQEHGGQRVALRQREDRAVPGRGEPRRRRGLQIGGLARTRPARRPRARRRRPCRGSRACRPRTRTPAGATPPVRRWPGCRTPGPSRGDARRPRRPRPDASRRCASTRSRVAGRHADASGARRLLHGSGISRVPPFSQNPYGTYGIPCGAFVVEALEVAVDLGSRARSREVLRLDQFDRHPPPRHEEDAVQQEVLDAAREGRADVGHLAVVPEAETAAPESVVPHEHDADVRDRLHERFDAARAADVLQVLPLQTAGRVEQDVLAGLQAVGDLLQRLARVRSRAPAPLRSRFGRMRDP